MTELFQRSRIECTEELNAVVDVRRVDAILRNERNRLAISLQELGGAFAHLLAVLHAHVHSLRRMQSFVAVDFVSDVSHLAQAIGSLVDVAKRFFNADRSRNAVAHDAVGKTHCFGVETGHGLGDVGKSVAALVFLSHEVRRKVGAMRIIELRGTPS